MPNRTCQPPTPWDTLRVGDRVTYQTRRMGDEATALIGEIDGRAALLSDGRSVTADDYVRRIDNEETQHMSGRRGLDKAEAIRAAVTREDRIALVHRVNQLVDSAAELSFETALAQALASIPAFEPVASLVTVKDYRNWRLCYKCDRPQRTRHVKGRPAAKAAKPPEAQGTQGEPPKRVRVATRPEPGLPEDIANQTVFQVVERGMRRPDPALTECEDLRAAMERVQGDLVEFAFQTLPRAVDQVRLGMELAARIRGDHQTDDADETQGGAL